MTDDIDTLRKRAKQLREAGDYDWSKGRKESAQATHDQTRVIELKVKEMEKQLPQTPARIDHKALLAIMKQLPGDYKPWGSDDRDAPPDLWAPDCSCGCVFQARIEGSLGADWGVCTNPDSHRVGLLTFEHQGCRKFVQGKDDDVT